MSQFSVLPHAFNPVALVGEWTEPLRQHFARLPDDAVKLLYVGHMLPYKDLLFMLNVFAAASKQSRKPLYWFLTIAEEDWPAGYAAFVTSVAQLQLTERVILLGKLPGPVIGTLYQACDIVLFTSLCESFGWPLLEATSLSKPLFAVDVPLNRELAGAGARYYPYGDHAGAVQQLLGLLDDPQTRLQLGESGNTHFRQTHIDWATYVGRCLQITEQAVRTKG
jgi:glycosyltransferase involved in cell wall biosynthesis